MMKNCSICGKAFEAEYTYQKYCGLECKKDAIRADKRKYNKSAKGVASHRRYRESPRGKALEAEERASGRVFIRSCRIRGIPFPYKIPDYWNKRIIEEQNGVCAHPGCTETKVEADHKISRKTLKAMDVHETRINNIQFLCDHHNSVKAEKCADYHPKWLQDKLTYMDACFERMELCA